MSKNLVKSPLCRTVENSHSLDTCSCLIHRACRLENIRAQNPPPSRKRFNFVIPPPHVSSLAKMASRSSPERAQQTGCLLPASARTRLTWRRSRSSEKKETGEEFNQIMPNQSEQHVQRIYANRRRLKEQRSQKSSGSLSRKKTAPWQEMRAEFTRKKKCARGVRSALTQNCVCMGGEGGTYICIHTHV